MGPRTLIPAVILSVAIPVCVAFAVEYVDVAGLVTDQDTGLGIPGARVTFVAGTDTSAFVTGPDGHYGGIVSGIALAPVRDVLGRSYPNPVNAVTVIPFGAPGRFQVFDVRGRLLLDRRLDASDAEIQVEHALPAGVFLYRLVTDDGRQAARKMTVNDGMTRLDLVYVGGVSADTKTHGPEKITTTVTVTADGYRTLATSRSLDPGSNVLDFEMEGLSPCASVVFVDMAGIEVVNNEQCAVAGADCDSVDVALEVAWADCDDVDRVDLVRNDIPIASVLSVGGGTSLFEVRTGHGEDFVLRGRVFADDMMLGQTGELRVVSDLTDPRPVFTEPAGGSHAVWGAGDDADAMTPGFQAAIDLTVSDGGGLLGVPGRGDGWLEALYYHPFGGGSAQILAGFSQFTSDPEDLSFVVSLPVSGDVDTVSAVVLDGSGNTSETRFTFEISLVSCFVDFIGFSGLVGNSWCVIPDQDCGAVDVPVEVVWNPDCPGIDRVELRRDGLPSDTIHDPASGYASFNATFVEGESCFLTAVIMRGSSDVAVSSSVQARVDLQDPYTEFVVRDVNGFTTPAEGSDNSYGIGDDQNPHEPGLQIHASLEVADPSGGLVLVNVLRVSDYEAESLQPENISLPYPFASTNDAVDLYGLTFPEGSHELVATVQDLAGNTETSRFMLTVDLSSR